jgi:hypothetical protein
MNLLLGIIKYLYALFIIGVAVICIKLMWKVIVFSWGLL